MKLKLVTAIAAGALAAGATYAAVEMKDCCQGKECCCDKMKMGETPKPSQTEPPKEQ